MKTLKRHFTLVCILLVGSLAVIAGGTTARRAHREDDSQTKLKTLKAQLLQLEMKQLEQAIADMQRQEDPPSDKVQAEIADLQAQWQQRQDQLQQLALEVNIPDIILGQDLQRQIDMVKAQIMKIELDDVVAQLRQLKQAGDRGSPHMQALRERYRTLQREYNGLTKVPVTNAPQEPAAPEVVFSNSAPITIPSSGTSGPASPYPSTITVSGLPGVVTDVNVTLTGVSHTFPDDIDILLVGPGGQTLVLMSDCGGGSGITGITLTFDDSAATSLPDSTLIAAGTYKPTNYGAGDTFAAPAPAGPYNDPAPAGAATLASVFNGIAPNGTWSLFVVDDAGGDTGSISGGWSLDITTTGAAPVNDNCAGAITLSCPGTLTADTTMATDSTVNVNCGDFGDYKDVWYKFVGDGATHTICTNGSNYDTIIQIYTGTCTSLNDEPFCNDDCSFPTMLQSSVTFTATMGVTYFIQVSGFNGDSGNLVISCDNAAVTVTPNPLSFGSVHLGLSSAPLNTSVDVSGCGSVTFTGITEAGANPGDFSETLPTTPFVLNECSAPVTFPSTFSPTGPACGGARSATLTYMTSAGTVVQTLTGTAQNAAPVANAGPDQTVPEGALVTLAGSATDSDAHDAAGPFTFAWTQTGGPSVTLSNPAAANPTFTAPEVPNGTCVNLTFSLVVSDQHGCPDATPDTVIIRVADTIELRDDSNGNCVKITMTCTTPGAATYCFKTGSGMTFTGPCTVTVSGNTVNVQSTAADPNALQGILDLGRCRGNARLTISRLSPTVTHTITSNVNACDDTCACP